MKVCDDIKMFNRVLYYPICQDGNFVTYVKVTPADAIVTKNGKTETVYDASIIHGTDAEAIVESNIQTIVNYMLEDGKVTIVNAPIINPMKLEI